MTKEEVRYAGINHATVIHDCYPTARYRVKALKIVFASDEEIKRGHPKQMIIAELVDAYNPENKREAGPSQLSPACPELFERQMKISIENEKK